MRVLWLCVVCDLFFCDVVDVLCVYIWMWIWWFFKCFKKRLILWWCLLLGVILGWRMWIFKWSVMCGSDGLMGFILLILDGCGISLCLLCVLLLCVKICRMWFVKWCVCMVNVWCWSLCNILVWKLSRVVIRRGRIRIKRMWFLWNCVCWLLLICVWMCSLFLRLCMLICWWLCFVIWIFRWRTSTSLFRRIIRRSIWLVVCIICLCVWFCKCEVWFLWWICGMWWWICFFIVIWRSLRLRKRKSSSRRRFRRNSRVIMLLWMLCMVLSFGMSKSWLRCFWWVVLFWLWVIGLRCLCLRVGMFSKVVILVLVLARCCRKVIKFLFECESYFFGEVCCCFDGDVWYMSLFGWWYMWYLIFRRRNS